MVEIEVAQGSLRFQGIATAAERAPAYVAERLLLGPFEGPFYRDEIGEDEFVVQGQEVAHRVRGIGQHGTVEGPQHVQEHLRPRQLVQIALEFAFACAGLCPCRLAHTELGEGGLLGLEDLREPAHPIVAHANRCYLALCSAL